MGLPWWSSGLRLLPFQGVQLQSVLEELRSCMPGGKKKKKKKKIANEDHQIYSKEP